MAVVMVVARVAVMEVVTATMEAAAAAVSEAATA